MGYLRNCQNQLVQWTLGFIHLSMQITIPIPPPHSHKEGKDFHVMLSCLKLRPIWGGGGFLGGGGICIYRCIISTCIWKVVKYIVEKYIDYMIVHDSGLLKIIHIRPIPLEKRIPLHTILMARPVHGAKRDENDLVRTCILLPLTKYFCGSKLCLSLLFNTADMCARIYSISFVYM